MKTRKSNLMQSSKTRRGNSTQAWITNISMKTFEFRQPIFAALAQPLELVHAGAEVFVPARWLLKRPGVGKVGFQDLRKFLRLIEARLQLT